MINTKSHPNGSPYLSSGFHCVVIVSSFLYLTRFGFSPAYLVPAFLSFVAVLLTGAIDARAALLTMFAILILFVHTLLHSLHGATVNSYVLVLCLPLLAQVKNSLGTRRLLDGAVVGYVLSLAFFSIESIFRLANPTAPSQQEFEFHSSSDSTWFYLYKYGSFAFVDSNLTSIALLMLLCLGLCLKQAGYLQRRYLALNYILLLLCFSRAAAIGVIISLFLGPLRKHKGLAVVMVAVAIVAGYFKLESDPSFATKFVIYAGFLEAVSAFGFMDIVAGKGFGWFLERFGMASHSLFVQAVVEGGLIYSLLFIMVMKFVGAFEDEDAFIRFLIVLVPSLSASIYVMTLCWAVTIIYGNKILRIKKSNEKN